jgi:hypothetical protein
VAYSLYSFGGLVLPARAGQHNLGASRAQANFLQLPGGGYVDTYGSSRAPMERQSATLQAIVYATEDRRQILDDLRSMLGERQPLIVRYDDGVERWQSARLVAADTRIEPNNINHYGVALEFALAEQHWHGEDQSETADVLRTGSAHLHLLNAGNIDATDLVITFVCTKALSHLAITNNTTGELIATEAVDAGDTLIIDCGAMQCTNGGVAAYADLTTLTDLARWLYLSPGTSQLSFSADPVYDAGEFTTVGTITFAWTDHYA